MMVFRTLFLDAPVTALSWLGRQGTRAFAALFVIGIATPAIGSLVKPFLTESVFLLLCTAFMRIDTKAFKAYLRRPALVIAATAWTSLAVPVLFGTGCLAFGIKDQAPELFLAIMLQAIASPIMAAPALTALMGLDATLVLTILLTSTVLIPFTAPIFTHLYIGSSLAISPSTLGVKLFVILAGSILIGFMIRRIFGLATIERQKEKIDGFNIIILYFFIAAVTENVAACFMDAPMLTLGIAAIAIAVFFALLGLTTLLFLSAGREHALALGLMVSQRNMGLMMAMMVEALPDMTWLYFALAVFPYCIAPQILQPLVRRTLK
jgi:BASS family bile acid:Na+ symporter